MAFEFAPPEGDTDKLGEGSGAQFLDKAGNMHCLLLEFSEYGDSKNGNHIAKWEVLAHEDPSQVGRQFWDYVVHPSSSHKDGGTAAMNVLYGYAIALGQLTIDQINAAKREGKQVSFDLTACNGKQQQAFLSTWFDKEYERCKRRAIFPISDDRAKDYPRHAAWIAKAGGQPAPTTATSPNGQQSESANPFAAQDVAANV